MARRFVIGALLACGLACASTASSATRTVQIRSVWTIERTEVVQLGPRHFGGAWTNHAVDIWNPAREGEETFACTESGTIDLAFSEPNIVSSCAYTSAKECRPPDGDGTLTYDCAATCKTGPDGLLVYEGEASLVRGTGRFEGIRGRARFTAWQVVPGPHDYGYTQLTLELTAPGR